MNTLYTIFGTPMYTSTPFSSYLFRGKTWFWCLSFSYMFLVCVHISLCFHDLKWLSYSTLSLGHFNSFLKCSQYTVCINLTVKYYTYTTIYPFPNEHRFLSFTIKNNIEMNFQYMSSWVHRPRIPIECNTQRLG